MLSAARRCAQRNFLHSAGRQLTSFEDVMRQRHTGARSCLILMGSRSIAILLCRHVDACVCDARSSAQLNGCCVDAALGAYVANVVWSKRGAIALSSQEWRGRGRAHSSLYVHSCVFTEPSRTIKHHRKSGSADVQACVLLSREPPFPKLASRVPHPADVEGSTGLHRLYQHGHAATPFRVTSCECECDTRTYGRRQEGLHDPRGPAAVWQQRHAGRKGPLTGSRASTSVAYDVHLNVHRAHHS